MVRSNKLTVCPCTCSCVGLLYSIDHICELAGETDEMRMWRTDHRGKPLFLFQEPKKTLREERVSNNSIVLLEKGKLPAAGEISMALTVYRTMADVLVDTHQLVDLDWTPYSPANLANVGLREGYLTEELPSVPVLKDDTLLHLKRVILQQKYVLLRHVVCEKDR